MNRWMACLLVVALGIPGCDWYRNVKCGDWEGKYCPELGKSRCDECGRVWQCDGWHGSTSGTWIYGGMDSGFCGCLEDGRRDTAEPGCKPPD